MRRISEVLKVTFFFSDWCTLTSFACSEDAVVVVDLAADVNALVTFLFLI